MNEIIWVVTHCRLCVEAKKVGHELMPSFTLLSRDDRHKTYRPKLKHLTAQ